MIHNKFIKSGVILTFFSILAGFLGYLFQSIVGRLLSPADFVLFSALMSISIIFISPFGALSLYFVREFSKNSSSDYKLSFLPFYFSILKRIFYLTIFVFIFSFIFFDQLSFLIQNSDSYEVLLLFIICILLLISSVNNTYLQGFRHLSPLAVIGFLIAFFKLLFTVILIYLGLGIFGGLLGVILSLLITNLYIYYYLTKKYKVTNYLSKKIHIIYFFKNKFINFFPVLISYFFIAFLTQFDFVFVNHFFDETSSSNYVAIAILGKAILYLPGGIILALVPAASSVSKNNKARISYLGQSYLYSLILIAFAIIFLYFFGQFIINLLYDGKYNDSFVLLIPYSISMVPIALIMITEYFLIAINKIIFAWLSILLLPLYLICLLFFANDTESLIYTIGILNLIFLIIGMIIVYFYVIKPR